MRTERNLHRVQTSLGRERYPNQAEQVSRNQAKTLWRSLTASRNRSPTRRAGSKKSGCGQSQIAFSQKGKGGKKRRNGRKKKASVPPV